MITTEQVTEHADSVAAVLRVIAKTLDNHALDVVADTVPIIKAAIQALTDAVTHNITPDVVHVQLADLLDKAHKVDAKHDAELAAKFDHGGS